jgi:large repetitive protein
MASFNGYDRDDAHKRRQGQRKPRRNGIPRIEFLEKRQLLASGDTLPAPLWKPSDPTNLLDAQNGPMANLGAETVEVYSAWLNSNGNTSQLPSEFPKVEFQNGMVGLDVKSLGGSFSQFLTSLTDLGMQITTSNATYAMADGYAPINDLPAIAEMAQTQSGEVAYTPIAYASNYQGIAYNEAETSMFADVARTEFNVDGTGVTIGVLSTSVNQYQGGLSESYGTGDLNPNNPVNVIQDDPGDPTDEGRAMLENIHDIAPGANLQFATATLNELSFASNIEALQKAGSNIIVDDVGYFDEPMFQDGVVAQAVNTVVGEGVTYFSSAGNEGPDTSTRTAAPTSSCRSPRRSPTLRSPLNLISPTSSISLPARRVLLRRR